MHNHFVSFHRTEAYFFSMISHAQIDYGNLTAYATGVQAAGLNPAIVNCVDDMFSTALVNCQAFYAKNNVPVALVLPDYLYSKTVDDLLHTHDFSFTGNGVAMAISIDKVTFPSSNTSLLIKDMNGDLPTWSIPLIYGFESTPEVTSVYVTRHQLALEKNQNFYHFSGFIDNIIVCSLTLSVNEDNARIDDIATMPAYQKKGYATTLIYAALKQAKQLNVATCFLEASDSGFTLYQRIGFSKLFTNRYYENL